MSSILGISALYHDAAAALVIDGRIIAASEEERFSRVKHDDSLPLGAIDWINRSFLRGDRIDHVVFYERPLTKLDRSMKSGAGNLRNFRSSRQALGRFARDKMMVESRLDTLLRELGISWNGRLLYADHHLSHAASAFYPSQFESSAVLCLDGVGEWASSSIHLGSGSSLDLVQEGSFPHSIGLFYSTMTQLAGFRANSGEYKLMGLAPYGDTVFVDALKDRVIKINDDGSVVLNLEFFSFISGSQMPSRKLPEIMWGGSLSDAVVNERGEPNSLACDIAASAQEICNEVVRKSAMHALSVCGGTTLAMAGGVSLNSVAVGKLLEDGVVSDLFVQPASSDAGGSLGCALQLSAQLGEIDRTHTSSGIDSMRGSFISYSITENEIDSLISEYGIKTIRMNAAEMDQRIASLLEEGMIVGVCRGAGEFGPRALGNRSILASARDSDMQTRLNMAVKKRESFRPFAPAVLADEAPDWFEKPYGDRYMTRVVRLRKDRILDTPEADGVLQKVRLIRSEIPAVTHVDHTARAQIVQEGDPLYGILSSLRANGTPSVIVNTSFNRRGEPIVRTALEAFECFARTDIDAVVVGDRLILKSNNTESVNLVPALIPESD